MEDLEALETGHYDKSQTTQQEVKNEPLEPTAEQKYREILQRQFPSDAGNKASQTEIDRLEIKQNAARAITEAIKNNDNYLEAKGSIVKANTTLNSHSSKLLIQNIKKRIIKVLYALTIMAHAIMALDNKKKPDKSNTSLLNFGVNLAIIAFVDFAYFVLGKRRASKVTSLEAKRKAKQDLKLTEAIKAARGKGEPVYVIPSLLNGHYVAVTEKEAIARIKRYLIVNKCLDSEAYRARTNRQYSREELQAEKACLEALIPPKALHNVLNAFKNTEDLGIETKKIMEAFEKSKVYENEDLREVIFGFNSSYLEKCVQKLPKNSRLKIALERLNQETVSNEEVKKKIHGEGSYISFGKMMGQAQALPIPAASDEISVRQRTRRPQRAQTYSMV